MPYYLLLSTVGQYFKVKKFSFLNPFVYLWSDITLKHFKTTEGQIKKTKNAFGNDEIRLNCSCEICLFLNFDCEQNFGENLTIVRRISHLKLGSLVPYRAFIHFQFFLFWEIKKENYLPSFIQLFKNKKKNK